MAERPKGVVGWIRNLVGGSETSAAEETTVYEVGSQAVFDCESLVAEAICRGTGSARPADQAAEPSRNAFGDPLVLRELGDARASLETAIGLALSGLRTAAFLPEGGPAECRDLLGRAAELHLPLVVQGTTGAASGGDLDAAGSSGAFVLVARDAQEACDLTLAAHEIAERSLTPGVVFSDGPETAWTVSRLAPPTPEFVREFLGTPGSEIDCPTPSQALLFGDRRRRVPRWFDLDRPLASGVRTVGGDRQAAAASRRPLFAAHVASVADETLERLSASTGRAVSAIHGRDLDDARRVILCLGATAEIVEAVADKLRGGNLGRIGVLGLTRTSPFPADELRLALAHTESVTILERRQPATESTWLTDRVRRALSGRAVRVLQASCRRLIAREIEAAFSNMAAGDRERPDVNLGLSAPSDAAEHPRRQAVVQRTRRDYPELDASTLEAKGALDLRPNASTTVLLRIGAAEAPVGPAAALAGALEAAAGPHLSGRTEEIAPGVWHVALTASPEPLRDSGAGLPADVVLIAAPGLGSPLETPAENAAVVVAGELSGEELWHALPARWRRGIRAAGARLFSVADLESLIAAGAALAAGGGAELVPVLWRDLPEPGGRTGEVELPLAVRRLAGTSTGPENVARFWGEYAQPRIELDSAVGEIDPHLALGTVPASTASFYDTPAVRERLPLVDADRCTGCGACWVSCPDSSIGSVAIGPQALLDAAWDQSVGAEAAADPAAGRLKRAHKQLAARWAGALAAGAPGAVNAQNLDDAFAWLLDTMKVSDDERPAFERMYGKTRDRIAPLPLGTAAALFHDPETEKKGAGELLMLAVDERSCQGCGICAEVCPEDAIRMEAAVEERIRDARATWEAWEWLPDTSGKMIARAAGDARIGPLAAVLLSRHCLFSLVGGDAAEPGSGERVAVRQVGACVEYGMQRRRLAQVERLQELSEALRGRIGQALSQAVSVDDLQSLDDALDSATGPRAPVGPVVERMEALGERTDFDVPAVRGLVRTAQELERTTESITRGLSGDGRARYGVVVSARDTGSWMTTFPRNPFGVPVAVDRDGAGANLALGVACGFVAECVREARLVRLAELLLEAPTDLPVRQRELARLGWDDLTAEERGRCSPILLLAGSRFDGFEALLGSEFPVKLILLDSEGPASPGADPLLGAITRGRGFVASTSVAHPAHLFECVKAALDSGGPALVRILAPSPSRDGFPARATVERARLAVESRVSPLVRFDPPEEGGIGRGLSLEGNPTVEEAWARDENGQPVTPASWAASETRFAGDPEQAEMVRDRARLWSTLQELAGVGVDFAAKVEARLERSLRERHADELAALRGEYEGKLREVEERQAQSQATRLRQRLMQLAGYPHNKKKDGE